MSHCSLYARTSTLAALVGLLLMLTVPSAFADVGLVSSTPAEGSTVTGPLTEIRLEFAADAEASTESNAIPATTSPSSTTAVTPSILDSVLVHPDTSTGDWIGRVARAASIIAVLLGIGAFVFSRLVFEGSTNEARVIDLWARRAGSVIVLAVPLEILGQGIIFADGSIAGAFDTSVLSDALGRGFGLAILLRLAGGCALFLGARVTVRSPLPSSEDGSAVEAAPAVERERFPVPVSSFAIAGIAALTLSYLFDGHTVSASPGWLMKLSSIIHVLAGAIWVGGVAILGRILVGRHRRSEPLHTARLVIPFSTVAGASLAMVGLTGAVMALLILDTPAALFTAPWGRAMLAKLVLVASAAAIGAYNHLYLVPMLKNDPDHPKAVASIRATIRIETGLLSGAGMLTAILVSLSPV